MFKEIAKKTAFYVGVNTLMVALFVLWGLVTVMETPKESFTKPGLSQQDMIVLCESNDAIRPGCE